MAENLNKVGAYLDGWFEIIEGKADLAEQIREETFNSLREVGANVFFRKEKGTVGVFNQTRNYLLGKKSPGITTTIYISSFGKNLYLSWRSFIKPVLRFNTFLIMGLLAVSYGTYAAITAYRNGLSALFTGTFAAAIFISILVGIAGQLIKQNPLAFFVEEINWFIVEDISAMNLTIHKTILRAIDNNGIDISKLRVKQEFLSGKKKVSG